MVEVPLAGRLRARPGVDPRRARGDHGRQRGRPAHRGRQRHRHQRGPDRAGRSDLHRRRHAGGPVLRPAHRPVGPQEALPDHAGGLHRRDGRDGVRDHAPVLLRHPVLHRCRHRRRVRSDQLGHRRAHPGPGARTRRPDHQRLLLARLRGRLGPGAGAAQHLHLRRRPRVAPGVRAGSRARADHPRGAPARPREPPLAVHPRAGGRGRAHRRRHRGRRARGDRAGARGARGHPGDPSAHGDPVPRDRQGGLHQVPEAGRAGPGALRGPGVHLQRRHLQPRHPAQRLLRRLLGHGAAVRHRLGAGELRRPRHPGPPLRHRRAQADDRRHLPGLGGRRRGARSLPHRHRGEQLGLPGHLGRHVLPGLLRRQRGVPDGQRDLPDGDARVGDRVLLRGRHRGGRHHRATALRAPHRVR